MMKTVSLISTSARVSKRFAAALVLSALLFVSSNAFAADEAKAAAPSMGKIAVVDLQYLVANSKAGKSIRSQLDTQRNSYKSQIEKQESSLRTAEKELIGQQKTLSKEEFAKKGKAFQEKVRAAQTSVQQRGRSFDKAYAEALEKIREHIVKIVADMASKESIALVLNRQEVVLVDAKMDITKDVLKALDTKVSSIPVNVK